MNTFMTESNAALKKDNSVQNRSLLLVVLAVVVFFFFFIDQSIRFAPFASDWHLESVVFLIVILSTRSIVVWGV